MFQQYAKAFKSSQSQEVFCTLNKSQLPDANTGFEFFEKVVHWMNQDLIKKLPTGYKMQMIKIVGEWTSQLRIIRLFGMTRLFLHCIIFFDH